MDNLHQNQLERWAEEAGPPALKSALTGLYSAAPAVSRQMDERILALGREHSARRARMKWVLRYAIGSVAAAAAIILIVVKLNPPQPKAAQPAAIAAAEDLNRDGKLDILDAYLLARSLADKQPLAKEWDVNGDGVVNGKDVDAVALAAVKLKLEDVR